MASNQEPQLATSLRNLLTRLVKKLRKESVTGQQLSLTERSSMALLQEYKQLLPSELASMEKITNQSMSQILGHLFELGYVSRKGSETDKRKVLISLTSEGEKMLTQMRNERDEWLAKAIKESCTDEEQEWLHRALGPLKKLVDMD
ncbi:MarR family winged helix-turn-helix transcriptional regulator [Mucilaginibacter sp.]|jgi:DNA-binding MarR family transcriptional regulator|uniref:MarR family winged helix-turn-helix transcriptional regulator n=1 Tax=Mucilaginibacter sp. TaxID=1882438 RepID=UPI002C194E11|nr:MarR family transcriptional regulator [Mucilaginibacter sp.]HTI59950.1 MarR family transcriptional regulator [Mucilaginibacter sp.]